MGKKLADTTQLLRSYKKKNYHEQIAQIKNAIPLFSFVTIDKRFPISRKNIVFTFFSTFMEC